MVYGVQGLGDDYGVHRRSGSVPLPPDGAVSVSVNGAISAKSSGELPAVIPSWGTDDITGTIPLLNRLQPFLGCRSCAWT